MTVSTQWPDATGHFGPYGGRFVPETLIYALDQLEDEYRRASADAGFQKELSDGLRDFAGRPTPLIEARRFSEEAGCRVFLKREDLLTRGHVPHVGDSLSAECDQKATIRTEHGGVNA